MSEVIEEREGGDITYEHMFVEDDEPSAIQTFYNDITVLIIGVTGFLGHLLVEKLLRSCAGIRSIYVLVRATEDEEPSQRIEQMFTNVVFDRLHNEQPDFLNKIIPIKGDCELPDLGLSKDDRNMLINNVNIVFHVAGTNHFEQNLRKAIAVNVRSTRDLLEMAKEFKNLKSLVFMSTTYSNHVQNIERFYKTPITGFKLISLLDILNDAQLEALTKPLLKDWPNTFTFTKAASEDVLKTYGKELPIAIIRSSLVTSTLTEPISGWTNSIKGMSGTSIDYSLGLLHTLHCKGHTTADLVPGDLCINEIIVAAWFTGLIRSDNLNESGKKALYDDIKTENDIPIYNFVSSPQNPITWDDLNYNKNNIKEYWCSTKSIMHNYLYNISNKKLYLLIRFFTHIIPALLLDFVTVIFLERPRFLQLYKQIHYNSDVMSFILTKEWTFHNWNTQNLLKKLNETDRKLFSFDVCSFDWNSYLFTFTRGLRVYLMKDPLDTLPEGQRHHFKLKIIHYTVATIIVILLLNTLLIFF